MRCQISNIAAECELDTRTSQLSSSSAIPVALESSGKFGFPAYKDTQGYVLDDRHVLFQALLDEPSLNLQVWCELKPDNNRRKQQSLRRCRIVPCSLSMILYGPLNLSDDLGDFLQDHEAYLQDPQGCHHNVKYFNPQKLSSANAACCPMTFDLSLQPNKIILGLEEVPQKPDLLDILNSRSELPEAAQPRSIQTSLKQ